MRKNIIFGHLKCILLPKRYKKMHLGPILLSWFYFVLAFFWFFQCFPTSFYTFSTLFATSWIWGTRRHVAGTPPIYTKIVRLNTGWRRSAFQCVGGFPPRKIVGLPVFNALAASRLSICLIRHVRAVCLETNLYTACPRSYKWEQQRRTQDKDYDIT